jgi:hypothetical protein
MYDEISFIIDDLSTFAKSLSMNFQHVYDENFHENSDNLVNAIGVVKYDVLGLSNKLQDAFLTCLT